MNKFEQVSCDDLYSEVKDVNMGYGHMGPPCEQTDRHESKQYLPVTSLAGCNKHSENVVQQLSQTITHEALFWQQ